MRLSIHNSIQAFLKWNAALLIPVIFIAGCNKGGDNITQGNPKFQIKGVRDADLSIVSSGVDTFTISVEAIKSGDADTVFLYANDLPGGVYVNFEPINGATPFTSKVSVSANYKPGGGFYTIKINGSGHSGLQTYNCKVTLPEWRGWQLGSSVYTKESVDRDMSTIALRAHAQGGAILLVYLPGGSFPTSAKSYTISNKVGSDRVKLELIDGSTDWISTGNSTSGGIATGTISVDGAGKLTFKCTNVEMSDSLEHKALNCTFSE